jgi:two-component system response regulator AtoC
MTRVREQLAQHAAGDDPLWFTGEPGTGKKLAARTLHASSGRSERLFALLDCRAWTGEAQLRELWARAAGGTIYLEQVPAMDIARQELLLRLLHELAGRDRAVRLLASSLGDPGVLVEQGRLLPELPALLQADTVHLLPLRERKEEVPLLARYFLETICELNRLVPLRLSPETLALLERHGWPGNVQELRNAMEHAAILAVEGRVRPRDLPEAVREPGESRGAEDGLATLRFRQAKRRVVDRFEKDYLRQLLQRHAGNVTAASQQAGMLRSALQRLLRKHGLKSSEFRGSAPVMAEESHI